MLALGSAAIGAGGSIVSQIVGGVITSRREQRKAVVEEERWKLEIEAKRRDRQLEYKTELFGRFLSAAEGTQRDENLGKSINYEQYMEQQVVVTQLRDWAEEIGLLVPEVYRHVKSTYKSVRIMLMQKHLMHVLEASETAPEDLSRREQEVVFWIRQTREAIRSYINHEPVEWPEQLIAERKAEQRKAAPSESS